MYTMTGHYGDGHRLLAGTLTTTPSGTPAVVYNRPDGGFPDVDRDTDTWHPTPEAAADAVRLKVAAEYEKRMAQVRAAVGAV